MNAPQPIAWKPGSTQHIPNAVYSDPALYARELDTFFYGKHWSYVGLECEIPNAGDFKATQIGEKPVILVRNHDMTVHVVENRCAHKGVKFCQTSHGNTQFFRCPYHQWNYRLDGTLRGVPFRQGVNGQGGMPADFKLEEHGLNKLKVAAHNGAVFASFSQDAPEFTEYLGPLMKGYFERTFDGRKLTLLGYNRQRIAGNWKLMQENIKDPYHASLLHVFFITFGLFRADQKSAIEMDEKGRHAVLVSRRNAGGANSEVTKDAGSFKDGLKLEDMRVMDVVHEPWWGEPTVVMQTIFPSVIIQQQINSLSTRQIIPVSPGVFDFVWTHFGFADDDEAMTTRRLRQANLFGPAGYVSGDDGEVIEFSQQGVSAYPEGQCVVKLDGEGTHNTQHMVTETAIRAMYKYHRETIAP
jgi:salicylate 5-hydroxylase large subunit